MFKRVIILTIIVLISSPMLIVVNAESPQPQRGEYTFIMGSLFSPVRGEDGFITGKAIQLFYYDVNPFISNFGIVEGFTPIRFRDGPLVFLYQPGPFGLIGYVYGFCQGFEILEKENSIP